MENNNDTTIESWIQQFQYPEHDVAYDDGNYIDNIAKYNSF